MRLLLPFALALAVQPLMPAVAAEAAPTEAESRITAVTVYPDRAQITRTAHLTLAPGQYTVRFAKLPYALQADTLRVRGAGTAQATIHGFELQTTYLGHPPDKEAAAVETQLVALADKQRAARDAREVHARQLELLKTTANQTGEALAKQLAAGKAKLAEWQSLLGFLQGQQLTEQKALLAIDQQLRGLDLQERKLREQLGKLRGFRAERVRQVPVTLEVRQGGTLDLELDYVMPGARWRPTYDARLNPRGDRLDWRYYALVSQQTGEDWSEVRLKLSTARPAAGSRPPAFGDWFLSLYRPEPLAKRRREAGFGQANKSAMPAPAPAMELADAAPVMREAEAPSVQVADQGSSVTLEVARAVSIPADGEEHQAPVGQAQFEAKPGYLVVPRVTPQAYLEVETTHVGRWPILPGPVKAFVGADYVGTVPLSSEIAPGESFKLPMGVDTAVQVERKRLAKRTGTEGLIGKAQVAEYVYEVALANYKPTAQKVTLVEPLPQTTQDAIKVALLNANYAPIKEQAPGQASWVFTLAPSEKKVLKWGYKVEYPEGANVVGLD